MSGAVMITCTAGSREEAERLARTLVEQRLAACVQLASIDSVYRWRGAVEQGAEVLLLIKTTVERTGEVEAALRRLHGYDVPEILFLPVAGGSADYLAWLRESVSPSAETG